MKIVLTNKQIEEALAQYFKSQFPTHDVLGVAVYFDMQESAQVIGEIKLGHIVMTSGGEV